MAEHTISLKLPAAEVVHKDAVIKIRGDGRLIGTRTISRGNIEWYSRLWRKPRRMSWKEFDQVMSEN